MYVEMRMKVFWSLFAFFYSKLSETFCPGCRGDEVSGREHREREALLHRRRLHRQPHPPCHCPWPPRTRWESSSSSSFPTSFPYVRAEQEKPLHWPTVRKVELNAKLSPSNPHHCCRCLINHHCSQKLDFGGWRSENWVKPWSQLKASDSNWKCDRNATVSLPYVEYSLLSSYQQKNLSQ